MSIKKKIRSAAAIVVLGGLVGGCDGEEAHDLDGDARQEGACVPDDHGLVEIGVNLLGSYIDEQTDGWASVALGFAYDNSACGAEEMAAVTAEEVEEIIGRSLNESNIARMLATVGAAASFADYYDRNTCKQDSSSCDQNAAWLQNQDAIDAHYKDMREAWAFFNPEEDYFLLSESILVAGLVSTFGREEEALRKLLELEATWGTFQEEMCDMYREIGAGYAEYQSDFDEFSLPDEIETREWTNGFRDHTDEWTGIQAVEKEGNDWVPDGVIYCYKQPMDGEVAVFCTDNLFNDTTQQEGLEELKNELIAKRERFERAALGSVEEFEAGAVRTLETCLGLYQF